ncbi:MAG: hypothetical protein OEW08_04255 [Gammaproteobacteria bacterium]|nr:hypothetical protein [Gammaproteobacteria bacterium]
METKHGLLLFSVFFLSHAAQAAPPNYSIQELAAPDALVTSSYGLRGDFTGVRTGEFPSMNDYGDIGGRIAPPPGSDPRYTALPAIWHDGVLQKIELPACENTVTFCISRITGLNNYDIAIGTANIPKYPSPWGVSPFAPYYQHETIVINGRMGAIKGNGSEFGWSADINDRGTVVGTSRSTEYVVHSGDYLPHGFVWVSDHFSYEIGHYKQWSTANAINNANQVTGTLDFDNTGNSRAYLWQDGTTQDLGTLGGTNSEGWDISDALSPHVVGESSTANGIHHAFLWRNGQMQDLGTLGGNESIARSVNKNGDVVGYAELSNGTKHGFIWTQGLMYDLNNYVPAGSGWEILDAYVINKHGEVLVRAHNAQGEKYVVMSPPNTVHDARPVLTNAPPGVKHLTSALYGGTEMEGAYAETADPSGNNYTAGYFYSNNIDFDLSAGTDVFSPFSSNRNNSNQYARDLYITKTRADGSYGWTVTIGNGAYYFSTYITKMVTDANDNVYVAGWYYGDYRTYFGSTNGVRTTLSNYDVSNYSTKSFVAKYDTNGILQWTTLIVAPSSTGVSGLAIAPDGKILLSTIFSAYNSQGYNVDYRDIYILPGTDTSAVLPNTPTLRGIEGCNGVLIALSPAGAFSSGQMISPAQANSGCVNTMDVAVSKTGDIYLSGSFTGTIDVNPGAATDLRTKSTGVQENYLSKLNSNGGYAWTITHPANNYSDLTGVLADTDGGVYWFDANVYDRAKLRHVDKQGTLLWERSVMGDYFSQYARNRPKFFADTLGNVYITGIATSSKNFNTQGGMDYKRVDNWGISFVTKWKADGNYDWTLVSDAVTEDLYVDTNGSMTLVGYAYVALDYDPTDAIPAIPVKGSYDAMRMTFMTAR